MRKRSHKELVAVFNTIRTAHNEAIESLTEPQRTAMERIIMATMLSMCEGPKTRGADMLHGLMECEAEDGGSTFTASMWISDDPLDRYQ